MGSNPVLLAAAGAAALCIAVALVLLFRRDPRWAMIAWVVALFFSPVWLGVQAGIFVTALTAVTLLAIVSGGARGFRWSHIDTVMLVLLVAILLAYVFGGTTYGHLLEVLTMWLLPYTWGRLAIARVGENWVAACITVAAMVASVLAIAEFMTGVNMFHLIPGAGSSNWGTLQIRGGLLRAEGAFGHSIALGGTLAMSAAFALTVRWPVWLRAVALGLIGAATVLTFSRIGLIGLVITVFLSIVFLRRYIEKSLRWTVLILLAVGTVVALPFITQVFGEAGAEAEGSAEYRANLLPLFDVMTLLGLSPAREVLATGEDYFAGFRSIDSALILTGLRYGLIPLAILVGLLAIAIVAVLRGRGSPAAVALVAQIPAFATVALITQYSAFVWFTAGLAVASYTLVTGEESSRDAVPATADSEMMGVAWRTRIRQ